MLACAKCGKVFDVSIRNSEFCNDECFEAWCETEGREINERIMWCEKRGISPWNLSEEQKQYISHQIKAIKHSRIIQENYSSKSGIDNQMKAATPLEEAGTILSDTQQASTRAPNQLAHEEGTQEGSVISLPDTPKPSPLPEEASHIPRTESELGELTYRSGFSVLFSEENGLLTIAAIQEAHRIVNEGHMVYIFDTRKRLAQRIIRQLPSNIHVLYETPSLQRISTLKGVLIFDVYLIGRGHLRKLYPFIQMVQRSRDISLLLIHKTKSSYIPSKVSQYVSQQVACMGLVMKDESGNSLIRIIRDTYRGERVIPIIMPQPQAGTSEAKPWGGNRGNRKPSEGDTTRSRQLMKERLRRMEEPIRNWGGYSLNFGLPKEELDIKAMKEKLEYVFRKFPQYKALYRFVRLGFNQADAIFFRVVLVGSPENPASLAWEPSLSDIQKHWAESTNGTVSYQPITQWAGLENVMLHLVKAPAWAKETVGRVWFDNSRGLRKRGITLSWL